MESTRARGQCSIEIVLVLIVLTTAILSFKFLSESTRNFLRSAQISEEKIR